MNLAARSIIASVRGIDRSQPDVGPELGHDMASAISDALVGAGYVVIHREDLDKLRKGLDSVVDKLTKSTPPFGGLRSGKSRPKKHPY